MKVESRDVDVTFTPLDGEGQPSGEPQTFRVARIDFDVVEEPWPESDFSLQEVNEALRGFTLTTDFRLLQPLEETLYLLFGFSRRKARRIVTKPTRRQRHLDYQASRKIRRR